MPKKNSHKFISIFAVSICLYGYLSINIGLPAYPSLTTYFDTSKSFVKLSITILLLGFGFSQFIWGTLSEKFGRRSIVIVATVVAIFGSILTSISESILFFTIARFIEGFGAGYASVLSRSIIADSSSEKRLHKIMSQLVAIVAFAPAISPIIGGEILHITSWRMIYVVLAIVGGILLISSVIQLKETHKSADRNLNLKACLIVIKEAFQHRKFMGYFLPYSILFSGLITFYTISPYIFIEQFDFNENSYSYLLLVIGAFYAFGSFLSRKLAKIINPNKVLQIGYSLAFSSVAFAFLFSFLGLFDFYVVLITMNIYAVSCGIISPICNTKAILALDKKSNERGNKGITSSILGGGNMILSSLLSFSITNILFDDMFKLSFYISGIILVSFSLYYLLIQRLIVNPIKVK
ncbi:multidrug effflux MFS transporter [Aureivirga sp. CE67]|uniref:multidrug effflux MFS transporter n=1 Tax=Aureivirga sp. CE67 TaxID=1788983 RepID=UPI0018CAB45D|nr:multidrug effflux MFS transporter [Aureivirga sp. CE67]